MSIIHIHICIHTKINVDPEMMQALGLSDKDFKGAIITKLPEVKVKHF